MTTSEQKQCPNCGTLLPQTSSEELCPACAMSGALKAACELTEILPTHIGGPEDLNDGAISFTNEELPEFPCELGAYRLLGKLGQGGMGSVYEAVELRTGRRLALKMLGHKLDNPEMRQRFLREGRLAASVSHPNSLYVFGTEELEGNPVITMELASGGTLSDRLKRNDGPIPVKEAVGMILDVISGLEAALAGGVLHRDVKPSNCFVDPDGTVKVGDFGLSVSTTPQVDSLMTATGVIMGTPAYAPPEQLRGKELDHRADIYSVGATLFTLLTGKPPIEGNNAVEVVAAALEETPKLASELRKDVPRGLAQVIARCLAKKPEQRITDYAALRNALLPFSSAQAEPAPVRRRFLAGLIDSFVIGVIPNLLLLFLLGIDAVDEAALAERSPTLLLTHFGLQLIVILYYTICEGIWGAGLGKMLMGFRVIRTGGQPPGLGRAFGRVAIGVGVGNLGFIVCLIAYTPQSFQESGLSTLAVTSVLAGSLMYVTMRRHNGYATVWDLATGTRVVMSPRGAARPVVDVVEQQRIPSEKTSKIGAFEFVEEIVPNEWIVASDPALRRRVWMRRRSGAKLTTTRRDLARPGRNRWLQSVETTEATWDVFESRAGACFLSLLDQEGHVPWESLRHWLHDIATEVAAADRDESLPPRLSLDHIWITTTGRAVLLDEPWPRTGEPAEVFAVEDLEGRQRFLNVMASCVAPHAVPLHARPALQSLAAGSFEKLSFLAGNLRSLLTMPATIDRRSKAASLLFGPLLLFGMLYLAILARVHNGEFGKPAHSIWDMARVGELRGLWLNILSDSDVNGVEPGTGDTPLIGAAQGGHDQVISLLLAYGAELDLQDQDGWTALHHAAWHGHTRTVHLLISRGADLSTRNQAEQTAFEMVSAPWSEEMAVNYGKVEAPAARLVLEKLQARRQEIADVLEDPSSVHPPKVMTKTEFEKTQTRTYLVDALRILPFVTLFIFMVAQLIQILFFGKTKGFAVVNDQGDPAGRAHLLVRWLLTWCIPMGVIFVSFAYETLNMNLVPLYVPVIASLVWLVGVAAAIARPTRGLHDQITGCWLVRW
ncbi:MAG: protein kinase [Fuerstiella sp.]